MRELVRTHVQALNDREPDLGIPRYLTERARCEDRRTGTVYLGASERSRMSRAWFAAVPDGRMELLDLRQSDDFGVAEVVVQGTVGRSASPMHEGLPATGSRIELSFCLLVIPSGSRIAEERVYWTARELTRAVTSASPLEALSAREREVALYVQAGMRNGEIAALLGNSPNTVRNQLSSIFRKLDVSTRAELAALVARSTEVTEMHAARLR